MELNITRNGKTATVEVDITLSDLSQKEVERIEDVMGPGWGKEGPSNKLLGAMVYAKLLHTPFADLTYEEVDFDLSELAAFAVTAEQKAWTDDAVVIPMETTTGTVEAEVDIG